jgi:hypothetical protein
MKEQDLLSQILKSDNDKVISMYENFYDRYEFAGIRNPEMAALSCMALFYTGRDSLTVKEEMDTIKKLRAIIFNKDNDTLQ